MKEKSKENSRRETRNSVFNWYPIHRHHLPDYYKKEKVVLSFFSNFLCLSNVPIVSRTLLYLPPLHPFPIWFSIKGPILLFFFRFSSAHFPRILFCNLRKNWRRSGRTFFFLKKTKKEKNIGRNWKKKMKLVKKKTMVEKSGKVFFFFSNGNKWSWTIRNEGKSILTAFFFFCCFSQYVFAYTSGVINIKLNFSWLYPAFKIKGTCGELKCNVVLFDISFAVKFSL